MKKLSFIPMNLQLFAEDGGASWGIAAPQGIEGEQLAGEGADGGATGAEGHEGNPSSGTDPANQKQVQTPEQNAAFAQMRREAEQAKREAQQAKETLSQRDKWVAERYGKQGITTWAQYEQALAEQERQQMEQGWKDQGYDPAQIREIMRNDPEYQQLLQQVRTSQQQLLQQQGQAALNTEVAELADEYPDLKIETLEDVKKLPNFEKIIAKAQKGYSLLDAYESVNKAEIRKQQADAARQATLNGISGKSHLRNNGQGTEADTTVIPDDVLEMYKKFNPGKTMDEYKKHYKSSLGK